MALLVTCFAALAAVARGEGPSPQESVKRFRVAEGLAVSLVAGEPMVRQPVTMTFDDRGRMWVIQYLQYPTPVGLRPVAVDRYLRTKYDRKPEPPPRGPRGNDLVTILEDTDGDGAADRAKNFITGLNLASGLAIGHGGVFVAQAPYLLFYPDADRDDRPDGKPEVLLDGFGLEDAHAVVNSLVWGPDGWLYGAQGSTVTADIRGIGFQQGIWRYHPRTRKFELFSEGGGNTWGLDFDRHGNVMAGTNYGERILLHQVQGGYYIKGFSKHGPLHNPFTYGYFDHAPHEGHAGGHVTCGGVVYQANALGAKFRNTYIGANLLSNAVYWHSIEPHGSTFKTRYQGTLLATDDARFRPIDCLVGPDGALYVADWCDQRANHVIPEDTWDRTNGRIWRIAAEGSMPTAKVDLAALTGEELVTLLAHENAWFVREARRLLGERRDATLYPRLRSMLSGDVQLALEALFALYSSGGWNEGLSTELLTHRSADLRVWAVRLLGDERSVSGEAQARLVELAKSDSHPTVLSQLACTCKRLPGTAALPILAALAERTEIGSDPHIPLLLWWSAEDKALSDRAAALAQFGGPDAWTVPLVREWILPRLVRRFVAENSDDGYAACAKLLSSAPDEAARDVLVKALSEELAGKLLPKTPEPLARPLDELWRTSGDKLPVLRLAFRLGSEEAHERAAAWAADAVKPLDVRLPLLELLGQAARPESSNLLLSLLDGKQPEAIRGAASGALARYSDMSVAESVLAMLGAMPGSLRARAVELLCGRTEWSLLLLSAVDSGKIDAKELTLERLRQLVEHRDSRIGQLVEKRWGKVRPATPGEKQAQIVVLARMLGEGSGDTTSGHKLFVKHCATCHTLFGEGNKVGPDLTSADGKNRDALLLNIVDPDNVIRPEFVAQTVELSDGRVLTGQVTESTAQALMLVDAKNQKSVLARSEIESIREAGQSLMPERLLEPLQPQELRDLFRYLQSDAGPAAGPK